MAERFRLLVFDWDGTLVDSTGHIVAAAMRAIEQVGLPERAPEALREIIGLGLRDAWSRLFPELAADGFQPFAEAYREHYFSSSLCTAQPFEACADVLAGLAGDGYLLAVATGKTRRGLDHDFHRTGLGRFFHATRTADETRAKPAPDMLHALVAALELDMAAGLMIGDTEWDLEMARQAGMASVALCSGAHSRERLLALRPLACLDGVAALPGWLEHRQSQPPQGARQPDQRQADQAGGILAVDALEQRNAE